jgi:putative MFS transporter
MSSPSVASVQDPLNVVNRLERLPMTAYQNKLFGVVATAWLADQINVALLAFLIVPVTLYFHLTVVQIGILSAMTYLGQGIGNIVASYAADRWGRRRPFQAIIVLWGVGSFLAAIAWNPVSLMVFRCIIGIGVGGEAPIAQAILSEFIPANRRGRYISWMEGFWTIGYILSGVVTLLVVPLLARNGWRLVFVAVGLFSVVVFLARRNLPESPRWLMDHGKNTEAESVLSGIEQQVARLYGRPLPEPSLSVRTTQHVHADPVKTLWSRQYLKRTLMAAGLWFFALLGYFGLTSWLTTLLHDHGYSVTSSIGFVTLISLGGIPGFLLASWLIEKIGRKPTMAIYLILSAVTAYLYGHPLHGLLFVQGFMMQFFFFGMWCVLYAYTPELYPTRARSSGAGWASAFGRAGAILGPVVVAFMLKAVPGGEGAVFTLGAASFVVATLLVLVFGPETRGKVLEQIAD